MVVISVSTLYVYSYVVRLTWRLNCFDWWFLCLNTYLINIRGHGVIFIVAIVASFCHRYYRFASPCKHFVVNISV
jgi:hypothetical protein